MISRPAIGDEVPAARLRPVDLARAAEVSPSLVRLYEVEGFIPPAIRLPSGHRRYTQHHQESMLVARALRTGYGWTLARSTMRAVHRGDTDAALALANSRHAQLHTEAERLTRALNAIDTARPVEVHARHSTHRSLSIGAAAERLGLTPATLRHWESAGVTNPARQPNGRRAYAPADIVQLELVQVLRSAAYDFASIAQLLRSLETRNATATRDALATRQAQLRRQTRDAALATGALIQLIDARAPAST